MSDAILKRIPAGLDQTDYEKIKSCLMLTTSQHDGEALNAIRCCNEILKRVKKNWDEFWEEYEQEPVVVEPELPTIEEAFAVVKPTLRPGGFRDMIYDYEKQWKEYHDLSPRQREVLMNAFNGLGKPFTRKRRRK